MACKARSTDWYQDKSGGDCDVALGLEHTVAQRYGGSQKYTQISPEVVGAINDSPTRHQNGVSCVGTVPVGYTKTAGAGIV